MSTELKNIPPQAVEIEQTVLGIIISYPGAIAEMDGLHVDLFYKEANRKIYETIEEMTTKGFTVDLMTVTEQLKVKNLLEEVGGIVYVTDLVNNVVNYSNIQSYIDVLEDKYYRRELIRINTEKMQSAYSGEIDINDLYDETMNDLLKVRNETREDSYTDINSIVKSIKGVSEGKISLNGISTGIKDLDYMLFGLNPGLYIIGARPGMGKSSLALQISNNVSARNIPVGIFSLEMEKEKMLRWLISQRTHIDNDKIKLGGANNYNEYQMGYIGFDQEQLEDIENAATELKESHLYIDDTPGLNIMQLRAKAIKLKHKYDIQLLIVDYLQLMSGITSQKIKNRENEISEISRGLKLIQKELNIPVVALTQLNREIEKRAGGKPRLSDLRESGAIEQDADVVMFVHRPEVMGLETFDDGTSTENIAQLIIEKNRDGGLGQVECLFYGETLSYKNKAKDFDITVESPDEPF